MISPLYIALNNKCLHVLGYRQKFNMVLTINDSLRVNR